MKEKPYCVEHSAEDYAFEFQDSRDNRALQRLTEEDILERSQKSGVKRIDLQAKVILYLAGRHEQMGVLTDPLYMEDGQYIAFAMLISTVGYDIILDPQVIAETPELNGLEQKMLDKDGNTIILDAELTREYLQWSKKADALNQE
jgi:hypothetical protein